MSLRFVHQTPDLHLATLIASSGFVQSLSESLQLDVDTHLKEGQMVYSIFKDDVLVGFAIFKVIPIKVSCQSNEWSYGSRVDMTTLYLAGILLYESVQGQGITERVLKHVGKETGVSYFALRTQSLRMWIAAKKKMSCWSPNPRNGIYDPYEEAVTILAEELSMSINDKFVSQGFYGAPLYGEKPIHHDSKLQAWWDSICSFERGDAVLCIGRFK